MNDKNKEIISSIEKEIEKIEKKTNKIFFFVIDTKGVPSGSLWYIYKLAFILKEEGYTVEMLHTEDEFVGVGDWLGEEYASLPHSNVNKGDINTSPADVLFIPEIYANVMNQTKKLPCKRIAILQNYDYMVEQMPYSVQWGDLGIMNCITNSDYQASKLKTVFPYVKTTKITPYIEKCFGATSEPKQMVVNIVAKDQSDVKRVVKPFYWKYPSFKWVSFRDLRNQSMEQFAQSLREAEITVWIDDDSSFGYAALEAMKSGNIVMAKIPTTTLDWSLEDDGSLKNCCVWFDTFETLHKQLASVIRSVIMNKVPKVLQEEVDKVLSEFSEDRMRTEFINYLQGSLENRKKEMLNLIEKVKQDDKEENEKDDSGKEAAE